jgi:hypothetical protein
MVKAERNVGRSSNIQFIVSQAEENKIPGLNSDGDSGHPFILKGVDTITGQVNGFLNIAPALSKVASTFSLAAFAGGFDTDGDGNGNPQGFGLSGFGGLTVDGFAGNTSISQNPDGSLFLAGGNIDGGPLLCTFAQTPEAFGFPADNGNNNQTNLVDQLWMPDNASSAFEYMPNATFATFNTFGTDPFDPTGRPAATTRYVRDYPDDEDVNAGFRWKTFLDNGLSLSLNYFYHYSANPSIDLSWHDVETGEELSVHRAPSTGPGGSPNLAVPSVNAGAVGSDLRPGNDTPTSTLLRNAQGQFYGAFDPTFGMMAGAYNDNPVELRFTERLHRVHSFGAAFDYAFDFDLPTVIRAEFLYDKDEMQPIVDKRLLSIGDLSNALVMEEADYFKYVIGLDFTVMTNLLVSGQFIQFRNLDFEDESRTCFTQTGQPFDCSRYTADFPTLHLDNGMQQAEKNKEFYSLFFSKPFGPSQEHRWNNITIYEENGGWWNRFDVEYSFSPVLIGSLEWNQYWGDEDTQFGQFEDSSSFQVGLKYIFE